MKVTLVCCGRLENRYAIEFVEYYKNLGFSHIFICDNNHDGEEYFEDVLQQYIDEGFVTIENYRNKEGIQVQIYLEMYNKISENYDYDWIAFFDFDEFLTLVEDNNIKEYLNRDCFKNYNQILINWKTYGDNNLIEDDGRPCLERFTIPLNIDSISHFVGYNNLENVPVNMLCKCIIRTKLNISNWTVHYFLDLENQFTCNNCGEHIKANWYIDINYNLAYIKHFITKTIDEWINNKCKRGTGARDFYSFNKLYTIDTFFNYNKKTIEKVNYLKNHNINIDINYSIDPTKYIQKALDFCNSYGVNINLDNPQTIQDKIMWLNIYDNNLLKSECTDKIKLREYCKTILGEDLCIPILKVYDNANDINFDELPNQFVLKCNHGSSMNIVVKDKNQLNKNEVINQLNKWMTIDYAFMWGFEAHYHDIEHKIFIEQFMDDGHKTLHNYKLWCFNGEPNFYTINDGEGNGTWMIFFDMKNNKLPYKRIDFPNIASEPYKLPNDINLMADYARKLSEPFKLTRVDFYEINNKIYLSELTFSPWSANFHYENPIHEIEVGNMLKLN